MWLPITFVQWYENTGWRTLTEVGGTEHQRRQKEAPCPAHLEVPTLLLICFTDAAEVHLFQSLGMNSAVIWQLAEKSKLKIARAPLVFHFSSLLFLRNLALDEKFQRWDMTQPEWLSTCKGVNGQVTLVWLKVHAVDREVRASFLRQVGGRGKQRIGCDCLPASTSEPARRIINTGQVSSKLAVFLKRRVN